MLITDMMLIHDDQDHDANNNYDAGHNHADHNHANHNYDADHNYIDQKYVDHNYNADHNREF